MKVIKAAFIYTAGEVEADQSWIDDDRQGLNRVGITTFDYTITGKTSADLQQDLGDCGLIHVNGGNDFYLLLQAKKSGFDQYIKRQVSKGVIYTGSSAGSTIAAPDIKIACFWDQDHQYEKQLESTQALGLVDFIIFPHWASSIFKKDYLSRLKLAYRKGHKIILLNEIKLLNSLQIF